MSFTCNYCGGTFCSEHRLPENHDCDNLEENKSKGRDSEEQDKWFEDKDLKEETVPSSPSVRKPSLFEDILNTFRSNLTLLIILLTVIFFLAQPMFPGISPPITEGDLNVIQDDPTSLNPLTLYPDLDYLIERPWVLLTVVLMHGGFFHLFVNMVTFYFFGPPLERAIGQLRMLIFYLGAALISSLGFVVFNHLLGVMHGPELLRPAVGASGAVVAVVGVIAKLYPKAEVLLYFFIPMKIKTAVYAFGGFETFNLMMSLLGYQLPIIGAFASSAHLTGLIVGFWYGNKLKDKYQKDTAVFDPLQY